MLVTHSETLNSPAHIASRRGKAKTAGQAGSLLGRVGTAIWRYLEDVGHARAQRELRLLSARWAVTDPEMAGQIRAASRFDARSGAPAAGSDLRHAPAKGSTGVRT